MEKYNIYAGLGGSFGGAEFQYTGEFESFEDAMIEARNIAVQEYESYAGMADGVRDWVDVAEEYCEIHGIADEIEDYDMDMINELYDDEVESWIDYYVINPESDPERR